MAIIRKKGRRSRKKRRLVWLVNRLELQAQTKLHDARIVRAVQMQEAGRGRIVSRVYRVHRGTNRIVLRMVEQVEGLPTELNQPLLLDRETLEEAEVKVGASRIS
jgi:hypothetical protein